MRIGFAFIPQKATEKQVDDYIVRVKEAFPNCYVLLSAMLINGYVIDINKPFLDFITITKQKEGLVKRYPPLLAKAWEEGLNYLFFNIRILAYPVETFISFVRNAMSKYPVADLVIAEPRLDPMDQEFREAISNTNTRRRILVDTFLNFTLTQARDGARDYKNVNAGTFGLRLTDEVMKALQSVKRDEDSTLICPRMAWHISNYYDNLTVKTLSVSDVHISELGFDLERALSEIRYVVKLVGNRGMGFVINSTVSDFFATCEQVRDWKNNADENWFWEVIVGKLKLA